MKHALYILLLTAACCRGQAFTFFDEPMLADPDQMPAPAVPHELIILAGTYGSTNTWMDLTNIVQSWQDSNAVSFLVNNSTFTNDPASGEPKFVSMTYLLDGILYSNIMGNELFAFAIYEPVTNLAAAVASTTEIDLSWSTPSPAPIGNYYPDAFAVFKSTTQAELPNPLSFVEYVTNTVYAATGLTHGTPYYFYVLSWHLDDSASPQSVFSRYSNQATGTP